MVIYTLDYGSNKSFKHLDEARKEGIKVLLNEIKHGSKSLEVCIWTDNSCAGSVMFDWYDYSHGKSAFVWHNAKTRDKHYLTNNGKLIR